MHPEIQNVLQNAKRDESVVAETIKHRVEQYVEGYSFPTEDGEKYTPSLMDKVFIADAIHGILNDEHFLEQLYQLKQNRLLLQSLGRER